MSGDLNVQDLNVWGPECPSWDLNVWDPNVWDPNVQDRYVRDLKVLAPIIHYSGHNKLKVCYSGHWLRD